MLDQILNAFNQLPALLQYALWILIGVYLQSRIDVWSVIRGALTSKDTNKETNEAMLALLNKLLGLTPEPAPTPAPAPAPVTPPAPQVPQNVSKPAA